LFIVFSGAETVLGQQDKTIDLWMSPSSDLSLAALKVEEVPEPNSALTSVEQGKPNLDQSFQDFREWQLEKRRKAFEDTVFLINFRTFYFDRSDFTGAEKQAVAIGGWAGVKTGYFLDHIAFGATVYTTNPIDAPDDRMEPASEEDRTGSRSRRFYAEIRIMKAQNHVSEGYDTPLISRNDNRMLPNIFFEAVGYEFGDSAAMPERLRTAWV
jgi:hypothetical protein